MVTAHPLPQVMTRPDNSNIEPIDFITRQGMGYCQMADDNTSKIDKFNDQLHYVKLLDSPGSGNMYYLVQLHMNDEEEMKDLRLSARDVIHLQFNTGPNPIEPTWRGVVLKNPVWMETGRIALKIVRNAVTAPMLSPSYYCRRYYSHFSLLVSRGRSYL